MSKRNGTKNKTRHIEELVETSLGRRLANLKVRVACHDLGSDIESIQVWVTSPDFEKISRTRRDNLVWSVLQKLPDDIFVNITLVMVLTPEEKQEIDRLLRGRRAAGSRRSRSLVGSRR
jgi:stress-induced morphogen